MIATHAPGPYEHKIIPPNSGWIYSKDDTQDICNITWAAWMSAEDRAAHARLFEAAPELLESLECALLYYEMFRDGSPKGPTEVSDIASCRAAIAKATQTT